MSIALVAGVAEVQVDAAFFGRPGEVRRAGRVRGAGEAGRHPGGEAERVGAGEAGVEDVVDGGVAAHVVAAFAAVDRVGAEAARQPVVAGAAFEPVVADAAVEPVVAAVAAEDVVAAIAVDDVVAFAAFEGLAADFEVAASGARGHGAGLAADDHVVPRPAVDIGDGRRHDDRVGAVGPDDHFAVPLRPFGAARRRQFGGDFGGRRFRFGGRFGGAGGSGHERHQRADDDDPSQRGVPYLPDTRTSPKDSVSPRCVRSFPTYARESANAARYSGGVSPSQ